VLKRTYLVTVIDGEFCLKMGAVHKPDPCTFSVVTLNWSKIMGSYNTPDIAARDRR